MLLLPLFVISGCAQEAPQAARADYVEPAWMTTVRQANEEYQQGMMDCLTSQGVSAVQQMSGSVATYVLLDEDGNAQPGAIELRDRVYEECLAEHSAPEHLSNPFDSVEYQRAIEVRACLIAQGYDLPEAPSEQAWIELMKGGGYWSPYNDIHEAKGFEGTSDAERLELTSKCPQTASTGFSLSTDDVWNQ